MGDYKEDIVATRLNTTPGPWPWDAYPVSVGGEIIGWFNTYTEEVAVSAPNPIFETADLKSPRTTYGFSNTTVSNVLQVFDDYFPSSFTVQSATDQPTLRYKNYLDGPKSRKLKFNPFLAPNNLTRHMERLATAITNVMRSALDSNEMIAGEAYNKKQFVLVRWEWLAFPIALLILSLLFLVATILKTSKDGNGEMGIWKTSAMPTLIYSLPGEVQRELRGTQRQDSENNERMKKVKIRLLPAQGWRVSGYSLRSPTSRKGLNHQPPPGWI